jgi:hypothetical protein
MKYADKPKEEKKNVFGFWIFYVSI